jgi:hypothetical protein
MTTLAIGEAVRLCTAWSDQLARDHGYRRDPRLPGA